MSYEHIQFNIENSAATLVLNRPDRLNSFTVAMHEEVRDALQRTQDGARALLLTGAGKGFCAGQDLNDRSVTPGSASVDLGESCEKYWNPLVQTLATMEMPVICAVNGVAAGAGANLALACDIVIAKKSAKFIQSFANIGLIPDSGGTWVLPRLVGQARALGMALTGEPIKAEQAENWGLIWKAVDDEELSLVTTELLNKLATGPTLGLAETKKRIRTAWSNTLTSELDAEKDAMRMLGGTEDYSEGVAAFLEKRKAVFKGK